MIKFRRRQKINLALQGGGAFGAFTWGVIDRLLEDPELILASISGTSAGSVNAVATASGYLDNGAEGARQKLKEIWHDIAESRPQYSFTRSAPGFDAVKQTLHRSAQAAFERLSHVISPYDLNPLDINPLRNILESHIDFDQLKSQSRLKLFIAATSIATGQSRIFRNHDLSIDVVLASCCLPTLFKAIEIDGEYYWDGGYSANPDLKTMVRESRSGDTIIVLLNPLNDTRQPRTSAEISDSINRITFNQPFLSQCDYIRLYRQHANFRLFSPANRRMIHHRFHVILSGRHTNQLAPGSKSNPDLEMLLGLFRSGREETELWISQNRIQVGRSSTFEFFR